MTVLYPKPMVFQNPFLLARFMVLCLASCLMLLLYLFSPFFIWMSHWAVT